MADVLDPTDLNDLVGALQRELAVPGEFATVFPNTTPEDLAGSLADSFGQAQIDGFFPSQVVDPFAFTVTPGLSAGGAAVVVLYAAERTIRAQLRTIKTMVKYEAAGVSYETQTGASILVEELKEIAGRRKDLLAAILRQARAGQTVYVGDGYLVRSQGYFAPYAFGELGLGFYGYEISMFTGFGSW